MAPDGPAPSPPRSVFRRLMDGLHQPEDVASLAVFRFAFGAVMTWDILRYIGGRWVRQYFFQDIFLFKYYPFGWVDPLPPWAMTSVMWITTIAAAGVALGAWYRFCALILFLGHGYLYLLSAAHYLNHAYLICILTFLMIFLPAHRGLSVDAWRDRSWARKEVPRWARGLIVFQLGVVYAYGGIAKLNTDWLVYRAPIGQWLQNAAARVPYGKEIFASEFVGYVIPYGGVVYDLFIVPALIWRKTRWFAVGATLAFHLTNAYMFNIGVFPWLMLAATPIFFESTWPRRLPYVGPVLGRLIDVAPAWPRDSMTYRRTVNAALLVWAAIQILVPLRHYLYAGDVAWTEEGHKYSWRMKLRSKTGKITYRVVDPQTGRTWTVDPGDELTRRQARKIRGRPEFILQYAHRLDERFRTEMGVADPEVYVDAFVSLNYRKKQRFVDPDVDLSEEPESIWKYDWILPFEWTPPPPPKRKIP